MSPRENPPVETHSKDDHFGHNEPFVVSRRTVLGVGAAVVAVSRPASGFGQGSEIADNYGEALPGDPAHSLQLQTTVNGQPISVQIDARTSLLDLLRERLALSGAKKGCDHAQCGACTVHVDGRRVTSCMTLAAKMEGRQVLTIEGLSGSESLHPMQQAFIDHDALQCGYCTPGQIMAAVACVTEGNAISREQIKEFMSGNICRCGAYVGIVAAIEDAAAKMGRG
ncbi:(2Fe-2S)-binding protein [Rhizobium brockwellii]|uniref:(2Fe-2S)-binding protein n=1 Tax=Rhizobium brockwellii TaxID=3019932 RepID=UPI003F9CCA6E